MRFILTTDKQREGYDLAKGIVAHLVELLLYAVLTTILFAWIGWGTDDSDKDGWTRSGLRVHVDHKTGVQYLSDGDGGLIRRAEPEKQP